MSKIKEMALTPKVGMELGGWFKFEAVRPDGARRLLSDWQPNLILNQGLNRMGSGSFIQGCQVGTGSTTPAVTDAALAAFYARQSFGAQSNGAQSTEPYYSWRRWEFTFSAFGTNQNITEVGIDWASGANLFSRALIKDSEGDPVALTVLGDEQLIVTYELRIYPPLADVTGTISGYDYTLRACNVTASSLGVGWNTAVTAVAAPAGSTQAVAYDGAMGTITGQPTGTVGAAGNRSSATDAAYGSGNYYRDMAILWNLTAGNFNILSMRFAWTLGTFQIQFSPAIPKTADFNLTFTPRITWARRV